MMVTTADLSKMLRSRVLADVKSEVIRAKLGRQTSSGWEFDVPGKPAAYNYITIMDGEQITISNAINFAAPRIGGLEVFVGMTPDGERMITGVVPSSYIEVTSKTNTSAIVAPHSHAIGSGLEYPIEERRLAEGRVHPTSPASLSVRVEPFDYVYQGARKHYAGGTLDLTSYIPGTANQHCWVLVGLDPVDGSLTAEAGTATAVSIPLTRATLSNIALDNMIPLAGVKLRNGQTSISAESSFMAARPIAWITGSSASSTTTSVWDVDKAPADPSAYDDEFPGTVLDDGWTEYDSQAQQTVAVSGGYVDLTTPVGDIGSDAYVTGLYKALPAGDFTIEAALRLVITGSPSASVIRIGGVALFEDATDTTKQVNALGVSYLNAMASAIWADWTDEDTFQSFISVYPEKIGGAGTYYYRLVRSGSSYGAYWSNNGTNWAVTSITPGYTPSHFGLVVFGGSPGTPPGGEPDVVLRCEFVRYYAGARTADDPVYGAPIYTTSDDVGTLIDTVLTDASGNVLVDASGNLITE